MNKGFVKLLVCIAAAFLNDWFFPRGFNDIFQLVLYLDTIFIIAITLLWGLKWGLITAGLSAVLAPVLIGWGLPEYLYALCFIATAFTTYWFMCLFPAELWLSPELYLSSRSLSPSQVRCRELFLKTTTLEKALSITIVLIILAFALCIVISILSGSIAAIILSFSPFREAAGITAADDMVPLLAADTPLLFREILIRVPINIIDRLASVFIGYGAAKGIAALIGTYNRIRNRQHYA
jgi:hypothetical protein